MHAACVEKLGTTRFIQSFLPQEDGSKDFPMNFVWGKDSKIASQALQSHIQSLRQTPGLLQAQDIFCCKPRPVKAVRCDIVTLSRGAMAALAACVQFNNPKL